MPLNKVIHRILNYEHFKRFNGCMASNVVMGLILAVKCPGYLVQIQLQFPPLLYNPFNTEWTLQSIVLGRLNDEKVNKNLQVEL